MDADFLFRNNQLQKLADYMLSDEFSEGFCDAYISDTAFVKKDVYKREILTPASLLKLIREQENYPLQRKPLGKVAVLIPKNSLGLTLAKAIASSYLMGNHTIIYFPGQLKETAPIYSRAILKFLDNTEIADSSQSSSQFMRNCLNDPSINAIVIYGDDSWIDAYKDQAEQTKTKIIFEGPGNDPMVVMADADLDAAVSGAIEGGLNNGGQSCSAIERYFIHEDIIEEFTSSLIKRLQILKIGSPGNNETDIGPIASKIIFKRMQRQISDSIQAGAKLRYGGDVFVDEKTGFPIMTPAVLTNCNIHMSLVSDETFGPVFPLISFKSSDNLIPMLDSTNYGLNACIYGTGSDEIINFLKKSHRNFYHNSTSVSPKNLPTRLLDGGYKRSGIIWNFDNGHTTTTGVRLLTMELSLPAN